HSLEDLKIFFSEFEGVFRRSLVIVISDVRSQSNLEPERQFHLIPGFTQAFDRFGNLRRILNRLVNRRADLANYLFCVFIDVHFRWYATPLQENCQLPIVLLEFPEME